MIATADGDRRAQTEPLAALIAVAAVAVGIGIYGAYVADVLPGTSADAVEEPTLRRVWDAIADGGIYPSTDNPWHDVGRDGRYDSVASPLDGLDDTVLPRGSTVYMAVTTVNESADRVVLASALYDESGAQVSSDPAEPPERGRTITRPIPVAVRPGDVRAGTLRVVVW